MASILKLGGKYRAQVRRPGMKSRSKTFSTRAAAAKWARTEETKIDEGNFTSEESSSVTVGKLVQLYRERRENGARPVDDDSNENYMLQHLETDLGSFRVAGLTPKVMTEWARERSREGAGGYTINMELSKLGTVLRAMAASLNLVFPDVIGAARVELLDMQLISGGNRRKRRPSEDELVRVLAEMPPKYARAAAFAAMSTLRLSEVCRITRDALRAEHQTIWVYGRKHPRKKEGVDEEVPLTDMALEILLAQPQEDGDKRFFPLNPKTLSEHWHHACVELRIPDLRFHDLRHEGTSLLFEEGADIPVVALYTGHKTWDQLKRYTNLSPQDLKFTPEQRRERAQKKRRAVRNALGPKLKAVGE